MRLTLKIVALAASTVLFAACSGPSARPPEAAPRSADEAYAEGRAEHLAAHAERAAALYRSALALDPAHAGARNGLATLAAERGDLSEAIGLWRALATQGTPAGAYVLRNLGHAYTLAGDSEHAVGALERACVLDPTNARAWQELGSALDKLGQHERAQRMFAQSARLQTHAAAADYAVIAQAGAAAQSSGARAAPGTPSALQDKVVAAPHEALPSASAPNAGSPRNLTGPAGAGGAWTPGAGGTRAGATAGREAAGDQVASARGVSADIDATLTTGVRTEPVFSASDDTVAPQFETAPEPVARLEVCNGNGVTGMAAATARTIPSAQLRLVKLSNEAGFKVARTRVEYEAAYQAQAAALAARFGATLVPLIRCEQANVRLVLGHDRVPKQPVQQAAAPKPVAPSKG